MTTKRNKKRPKRRHKNKNTKSSGERGEQLSWQRAFAGREGRRVFQELKRLSLERDLSHRSTYKRKPSRITMVNKC